MADVAGEGVTNGYVAVRSASTTATRLALSLLVSSRGGRIP